MKTIGIKLADGSFYPIMEEGSVESKTLELTTANNDQTCVMVDLYSSETGTIEGAEYIDTLKIENLNAHPNGEANISFSISLDQNGELATNLVDTETGVETESVSSLSHIVRDSASLATPDDFTISDSNIPLDRAKFPTVENAFNKDLAEEFDTDNLMPEINDASLPDELSISKNDDLDFSDFNLGESNTDDMFVDSETTRSIPEESVDFSDTDLSDTTLSEDDLELPDISIPKDDNLDFTETSVSEDALDFSDTTLSEDEMNFADTELSAEDSLDLSDNALPSEENFDFASADLPSEDNLDFTETPASEDALDLSDTQLPSDDDFNFSETELSSDGDLEFTERSLPSDDLFDNTEKETAKDSEQLSFKGLYDKETEQGESGLQEDVKKKTKIPVLICIICAIICIIATTIVLFILPLKSSSVKKAKKIKQKTEITSNADDTKASENAIVVIEDADSVTPNEPVSKKNGEKTKYKIKWGDTLWDISNNFYKNPWKYKKIANYNKLQNPDYIISGTVITIPAE